MKNLLLLLLFTGAFAACNESEAEETTATDSTVMTKEAPAPEPSARKAAEGDVSYEGGRVRLYRDNTWGDVNEDIMLDNGVVIRRDGRAMKDGEEYALEDGYIMDREGNVWDKTGKTVSDAWDATKHGVKKGAQAVGDAAEKAGEKARDAVD